LFISISRLSENLIQCVVEDNGVGREKSKKINKRKARPYQSFGLKATTKRLDLLNFEKENKIGVTTLDLFDKSTAIGTRVVLTIPIFKINNFRN
jgi:sensor histidine kinase YesM